LVSSLIHFIPPSLGISFCHHAPYTAAFTR
jgi:hypothetical protein